MAAVEGDWRRMRVTGEVRENMAGAGRAMRRGNSLEKVSVDRKGLCDNGLAK